MSTKSNSAWNKAQFAEKEDEAKGEINAHTSALKALGARANPGVPAAQKSAPLAPPMPHAVAGPKVPTVHPAFTGGGAFAAGGPVMPPPGMPPVGAAGPMPAVPPQGMPAPSAAAPPAAVNPAVLAALAAKRQAAPPMARPMAPPAARPAFPGLQAMLAAKKMPGKR